MCAFAEQTGSEATRRYLSRFAENHGAVGTHHMNTRLCATNETWEAASVVRIATFREPVAPGDGGSDGFTYALREELVGSRTLGDFLPDR